MLWFTVHDILGYFCIHKGVYHSLPFLRILKRVNQVQSVFHTQEDEPASRVFVTRYKGFPILNTTHIRRPSLLLYDDTRRELFKRLLVAIMMECEDGDHDP